MFWGFNLVFIIKIYIIMLCDNIFNIIIILRYYHLWITWRVLGMSSKVSINVIWIFSLIILILKMYRTRTIRSWSWMNRRWWVYQLWVSLGYTCHYLLSRFTHYFLHIFSHPCCYFFYEIILWMLKLFLYLLLNHII